MKNHVFRPLVVVVGLVCIVLAVRVFYVPKSFGVHERGYMYGWYREANVKEWQDNVKVKYQGREYCSTCHADKLDKINKTPHSIIQCENCHGPAFDHPNDPPKLVIDRTREHCLRCHAKLPYPSSGRSKIRGVDNDSHNPGMDCSGCHNPHSPMEGLK